MSLEQDVFRKSRADAGRLKKYGFTKTDGRYIYERDFAGGAMRAVVEIDSEMKLTGKVFDKAAEDEYTAFRVQGATGKFAGCVKAEYIAILEEIRENCFDNFHFASDQSNRIEQYINREYGAEPEFLWKTAPGYGVFRNPESRKWFAVIMDIDRSKLEEGKTGEVEILNVKLDGLAPGCLEKSGIYKAYHMNKQSWVSVVLDESLSDDEIHEMIQISHKASAGRPAGTAAKGRPGQWLIPANPQYYDIIGAFEDTDTIRWKQSSHEKAGDTVHNYGGSPVSAVLFRCVAVEVDIPYRYRDKNLSISRAMRLKLTRKYPRDLFTRKRLMNFGIKGVRGPRGIPEDLAEELER